MTHAFKTTVCLLIILGLILPYVAMASLSEIAGAPKCAIKNALRNILRDIGEAIRKFLKAVIRAAACAAVSFFTGGAFGCSTPDKVEDSATSQDTAKEFIYDPVARCISRGIFDKSVNGVLALVREGGRDGGETWIKNWRNFETNAEYRGENIFRAELSNTKMCDYFEQDLKNTFGVRGKTSLKDANTRTGSLDPFSLRVNCTLPSSFNMASYQSDFAGNGGWEAWSRLLEPQNNYYGTLFGSLDEANKQRNIEKSSDLNQALAGRGYLSISGDGKNAASSCKTRDLNGKCLIYNDIKTPGSTIGDSVSTTVEKELEWVVSSDELNELLVDISERLVSRLKDLRAPDKEAPIEIVGEYQGGNYGGLPDPEDPVEEPPPSEPNPSPPGGEPGSLLSDVQAERGNYGTPMTPAQLASFLNAVAWKNSSNGWGLLSKPGGTNCPFASGPVSCDILFHKPSGLHYDVLIDSDGAATPTWSLVGSVETSRWLAPVQP
ncbi:MAG: hypothetical protein HYT67_01195 [Candidatus Yanofskybacteria bacterium]|nr:hypothetical protein [Candidatus Yanofskybacteria bacterium]